MNIPQQFVADDNSAGFVFGKFQIRTQHKIKILTLTVDGNVRKLFGFLAELTSPSFCTTANERVYITTSSGNGANGGSQGAVGDRRAAICGANAAGAGGL